MKTRIGLMVLAILTLIVPVVSAQDTSENDELCVPTPPDALGPYFIEDAPETLAIYPDDAPGDRLLVHGTVYLGDCETPLEGAVVEVWQADSTGEYDFSEDFIGRGMVITDENGYYEFITVVPGEYEPRPPHIHYRITHEEEHVELVTQLYFEDSCPGMTPDPQVTTLEDFDLDAFLAERLEAEQELEPNEDELAAMEDLYANVLYSATFNIVLVRNR